MLAGLIKTFDAQPAIGIKTPASSLELWKKRHFVLRIVDSVCSLSPTMKAKTTSAQKKTSASKSSAKTISSGGKKAVKGGIGKKSGKQGGAGKEKKLTYAERPKLESLPDGRQRCAWGGRYTDAVSVNYHDTVWGRPIARGDVDEDVTVFERLCLELFASGLSFSMILKKTESLRKAFANFDFNALANWTSKDEEQVLKAPGIIANKQKISAVVKNARVFNALRAETGSTVGAYLWDTYACPGRVAHSRCSSECAFNDPDVIALATKVSKDFKGRGASFVGPSTAQSWLETIGVMNNHFPACFVAHEIEVLTANEPVVKEEGGTVKMGGVTKE